MPALITAFDADENISNKAHEHNVSVSANYASPLVDAAGSGDREAQTTLIGVTTIVERHGVPGTDLAASLAGMRPGASRLPLQPLVAGTQQSITDAYEKMKA